MEGDQYIQRGIMRRRGACAREKDHHANIKITRNWRSVRRGGAVPSARGNLINGSIETRTYQFKYLFSFPVCARSLSSCMQGLYRSPTTIVLIAREPRPFADGAVLVLRTISLFVAM